MAAPSLPRTVPIGARAWAGALHACGGGGGPGLLAGRVWVAVLPGTVKSIVVQRSEGANGCTIGGVFEQLSDQIDEIVGRLAVPRSFDAVVRVLGLAERLVALAQEATGDLDADKAWQVEGATSMTRC
jgi:hypothetical protein